MRTRKQWLQHEGFHPLAFNSWVQWLCGSDGRSVFDACQSSVFTTMGDEETTSCRLVVDWMRLSLFKGVGE